LQLPRGIYDPCGSAPTEKREIKNKVTVGCDIQGIDRFDPLVPLETAGANWHIAKQIHINIRIYKSDGRQGEAGAEIIGPAGKFYVWSWG
jgi:hypothetical protein